MMVSVAIRVAVAIVALGPLDDVAEGVMLSSVAEESQVAVDKYGHPKLISTRPDGDESLIVSGQEARERIVSYSGGFTTGYGGGWDHPEIPHEDIDAWIYCPRKDPCMGFQMAAPMVVFAQDALEGIGARTRTATDTDNMSIKMLNGIRAAVAKGRQPLVLGLGVFAASVEHGAEFRDDMMKAISKAGAYLVVYQTEQGIAEVGHHLNYADQVSAKEMWDFSLQGVRHTQSLKQDPQYASWLKKLQNPNLTVRYLPPGYSKFFETGVDLFSPKRREDLIGFLGTLKNRPPEVRLAYEDTLGTLMNQTHDVHEFEELREWCNALPLQINIHARPVEVVQGQTIRSVSLEAFRLAPLLANKACVISQPGLEEDMAQWDGMIHFADVHHTKAKLRELQQDVRGCQEQSYQKFKVAFDPLRIMQNSGFLDAWQPPSKLLRE